jgi:anti-sigma factor RsiW
MRTAAKSILTRPFNNSGQIPSPQQSLRQLNRWLGISAATERSWTARLPAVCAASVCLALYAWFTGLPPVRVEWLIVVCLAVIGLGMVSD